MELNMQPLLDQLERIATMLADKNDELVDHPLLGREVLVRAHLAGVHFGKLLRVDKFGVTLQDARRLYEWNAGEGVALSTVAQVGLVDGRVDREVPIHMLTEPCEIMLTAPGVRATILKVAAATDTKGKK